MKQQFDAEEQWNFKYRGINKKAKASAQIQWFERAFITIVGNMQLFVQ